MALLSTPPAAAVALHLLSFLSATSATGLPQPASTNAPLMLGSGLRLFFPAEPQQSYCLVTDPCLHVNALFHSTQDATHLSWVQGLGIRSASHTLVLRAVTPSAAGTATSMAESRRESLTLAMLDYVDVLPSLREGKRVASQDSSLAVEVLSEGQMYLVTLSECKVRLLIRLHRLTRGSLQAIPHFLVDVLDWENLDSPHGIIGQVFPNHAPPHFFNRSKNAKPIKSSTKAQAVAETSNRASSLSVQAALDRLRAIHVRSPVLDGIPEDYTTTSLLEADCMFSRFSRGLKTPGTLRLSEDRKSPLVADGKDAEIDSTEPEEAETDSEGELLASPDTREHLARSAALLAHNIKAQGHPSKVSGTDNSGSEGLKLPLGVLRMIASTQGTSEVKVRAPPNGGHMEERLPLTKAELKIVSRTQGTTEDSVKLRVKPRRRQMFGM